MISTLILLVNVSVTVLYTLKHIDLKEVVLLKHNPWNGQLIRELDISRQTIIVMVKRNGTMLVPKGDLMLMEGDCVILYSQERISNANLIQI